MSFLIFLILSWSRQSTVQPSASKLPLPRLINHHSIRFLSCGELGPGNNIGLLASKTSATGIRGMYYGIAAATGKIGAFVGTWVFPYIVAAGHNDTTSAQYPFYVSSSLCLLSAAIVLLFIPHIGQDTVQEEDRRFRAYLESQGWDTRQLGLKKGESLDGLEERRVEDVMGSGAEKKSVE